MCKMCGCNKKKGEPGFGKGPMAAKIAKKVIKKVKKK